MPSLKSVELPRASDWSTTKVVTLPRVRKQNGLPVLLYLPARGHEERF